MKHKFSFSGLVSFIVLVLMAMVGKEIQAQSSSISYPFNTHYFFHKYPINPAYIGEEGEANIGLGYKKASGYPETAGNRMFAYVHGKSEAMKGGGFGVLFNYMDADFRQIKHTQLSLGATATYNQTLMDLVDLKIGITSSFLRYRNDNVPVNAGTTVNIPFAKFNLDAGVLLTLDDFELGVALHHNNQPNFQFFTSTTNPNPIQNPNSSNCSGPNCFYREFYITANYYLSINDEFGIEPHMIIQQNVRDKDLLGQISILADYQDMYFVGISYLQQFDAYRNRLSPTDFNEFHKLRLTGAAKFAEQFLLAASLDFATNERYKMQFETSIGYYFNRDDY